MERTIGLDSVGRTCLEPWQGKSRLTVASNETQLSVSTIFNVLMSVEKWLLTDFLLKVAAKCAILWNEKLWCGTLFLHKNKMKRRVLQAHSLKHNIKRGMCSVLGKMNLFGSGRWRVLPPPHPIRLGYAPAVFNFYKIAIAHLFSYIYLLDVEMSRHLRFLWNLRCF